MFFKKKNTMAEQEFDKKADNQDNLTQNEADNLSEEALAAELNTDDNVAGTTGLDSMAEDELEKMKSERDDANDKYVRLLAEFDNFRKRNAKERIELIQTAGKDIISSLLDVMDDMERAGKQMEKTDDIQQVREGVTLVFNKFRNIMQQKGLKAMESNNEEFDPEMHEAITEVPSPNEAFKGRVMDTIQPGYYLNDKLIRHAKVIVGK